MNLSELFDEDWEDEELEICLESARDKYLKYTRSHPTQVNYSVQDIKSAKSVIALARQIHQKDKAKSMELVALESYQFDLGLDDDELDIETLLE